MTYGLGTRAFSEDGSRQTARELNMQRPQAHSWRALDERGRLELIEQALLPLNERIDRFPLAL